MWEHMGLVKELRYVKVKWQCWQGLSREILRKPLYMKKPQTHCDVYGSAEFWNSSWDFVRMCSYMCHFIMDFAWCVLLCLPNRTLSYLYLSTNATKFEFTGADFFPLNFDYQTDGTFPSSKQQLGAELTQGQCSGCGVSYLKSACYFFHSLDYFAY